MQLLIDATGQVLAWGEELTAAAGQLVVDYSLDARPLYQAGRKYHQANGSVSVTPPTADESAPPAPPPVPPAARAAWQTLSTAAQADQNMQAIKVLFKYLNSQLS